MRTATLALLIALLGCDPRADRTAANTDSDDVVLAMTAGTNAIYFHRSAAALDSLKPILLDGIRRALDSMDRVVPVRDLRIRVIVFPDAVLPAFGVSGVADSSRIDLFFDPAHPSLRQGIEQALLPTLAHEFHHVLRGRSTVGYGGTLFEAMVSEGLAEQFVQEVTGRQPPWTGAVLPRAHPYWRRRAAAIWCSRDYDHAAWFIGSGPEIPRGTGFEVGAAMVGEYLAAHPGEKPSALHAAPARRFLPASLRGDPVADCWQGEPTD